VKRNSISGTRGDYEYGNVALLYAMAERTLLPVLKQVFPYTYEGIIVYVILREIQPLPMKSVRYLLEKTWLSRAFKESMTPRSISLMLSSLSEENMIRAMRSLTDKGEYVLMDSTAIFSRSVNIPILELGHNAHSIHVPQINLMMLFSSSRKEPTFLRIIPGSIRDVSAMKATLDMAGVERCVIITDKGFFSAQNVKELRKEHLSFIVPLRRNSSLIPETAEFPGVLDHDGRPVKFWMPVDGVFTFEDPILRMEEEKDYLVRIKERSRKRFIEDSVNFGKMHILSDLKENPEKIYRLYKQREYVEYAFNVFKNDLEADRPYLRDDHMLFSYLFLNMLALNLHFQILNRIDGRYSVRDALLILSRIKIYTLDGAEIMGEIPKRANDLVKQLDVDLCMLHKNQ
jgi:transposase